MKIVGMMTVYNDEDFISEVLENAISQGIELVLLDDGSTDNTYEICSKFLGKGILELYQHKSNSWDDEENRRIIYDLAFKHNPDWLILYGSDELLESWNNKVTLKDAISQVDREGYNLIQFNWFNFFLTSKDNEQSKCIKEKLKYYSWGSDYLYRSWKNIPGVGLQAGGGHYPIFPQGITYKIYPRKFVLRHYKYRNYEQFKKKAQDRIKKIKGTSSEKLGWIQSYKTILDNNFDIKVSQHLLSKYNENNNWNLERKYFYDIGVIGLEKDEIFTNDGKLKIKIMSQADWRLRDNEHIERITSLQKKLKEAESRNSFQKNKILELRQKLKESNANRKNLFEKLKGFNSS